MCPANARCTRPSPDFTKSIFPRRCYWPLASPSRWFGNAEGDIDDALVPEPATSEPSGLNEPAIELQGLAARYRPSLLASRQRFRPTRGGAPVGTASCRRWSCRYRPIRRPSPVITSSRAAVADVRRQWGLEDLVGLEIELGDAVEYPLA